MRRPRLVIAFRIRKTASPELSGRAYLAAARSRSRWVLAEGCPVLAVHWAFGLAPHIGQRTDKICFKVSFPGFTTTVFRMVGLRVWSILLSRPRLVPIWESRRRNYFVGSRETT
jgi:hypothetical protein